MNFSPTSKETQMDTYTAASIPTDNDKVVYTVTRNGDTIETRTSKVAYNFANIWKIEDAYVAELSRKPGKPGRVNQYGWILVHVEYIEAL
jgi:hypothetical protein